MGVGEQNLLPREHKEGLGAAPRKVMDGGCHGQCGVSKDHVWGLPRAPLLVPYRRPHHDLRWAFDRSEEELWDLAIQ